MGTLRITLFGGLQVRHDDAPAGVKLSCGVQRLLGYLLVKRNHAHTRDELTNLFWPEYSEVRARACLNTQLWRLRQVLEPQDTPRGTYLRTGSGNTVDFNWSSDHWLDVAVFEDQVSSVSSHSILSVDAPAIDVLKAALRLYTGELLEGIYDDWALFDRECMRSLYIDGLAYLMRYCREKGNHSEGARCGQSILDLDPLREEIHREMMRTYLDTGQHAQAIVQYETCLKTLERELGIPPMEETQALYADILQSRIPSRSATETGDRDALQLAACQLNTAVAGFEKAWSTLRRAVIRVEHLGRQVPVRDD
ncbi:MAG: hypothetical protein OEU49_07660 [Chromatiales bacterium]|nr:hypothetical protein [Chromatiales bacterium]